MKQCRPGCITALAVLTVIISVGALLLMVKAYMVEKADKEAISVTWREYIEKNKNFSFHEYVLRISFLFALLVVAPITTALGLLKMERWARFTSALIYGLAATFLSLGLVMMSLEERGNIASSFQDIMFILIYLALIAFFVYIVQYLLFSESSIRAFGLERSSYTSKERAIVEAEVSPLEIADPGVNETSPETSSEQKIP